MRILPSSRLCLILFVALVAGQGSAEPVPDDVSCGDDYWFTMNDPADWQSEWRPSGDSISLFFTPKVVPKEAVSIAVMLDLGGAIDADFDIEDALQRKLSLINAFGSPSEIRPFKIQHGALPTAGASLVFDAGTAQVAAIGVRGDSGDYFVATLSKLGGEPSSTELEIFRDTIASIDFDPRRGCRPGKDGEVETVIFSMPDLQPPAAKANPSADFDLSSGAAGCMILDEFYVPIDCQMTDVGGQSTLLVRFGLNDQNSARTQLDLFAQRVATPFCYEANRHPTGAPRLVFAAEGERNGFAYDCATKRRDEATSISIPER